MDIPNLNQLIRQEDWENVVALIEAGADIHVAQGEGYTPLMQAVDVGSFELVDFLLSKGVFINFVGREGNTALHVAVHSVIEAKTKLIPELERTSRDMIAFLLTRGANPNQKNDSGISPLDLAGGEITLP